jgi:outer membrane protein
MRKTRDIKNKIEEYLKGYNENNKFSYIVAYEPGLFYYRDTMFNITNDVLKGLNELKKTTKEKK